MSQSNTQEVVDAWASIESTEPDISTERLIAMTAMQLKCGVEDVTEALYQDYLAKGGTPL